MKYKVLLKILWILIYCKRGLWWAGRAILALFDGVFDSVWRLARLIQYKIGLRLKRYGLLPRREVLLKRDFLQIILGLIIFCLAIPQTKLLAKPDPLFAGNQTIAYRLLSPDDENSLEEIVGTDQATREPAPSWRTGALNADSVPGKQANYPVPDQLAVVAGGTALAKPYLIPSATMGGTALRTQLVDYAVEPGDSLSNIAYQFGVSVATILWENNLTERTLIRPGDILRVPPVSGVMHNIKRADTLGKIAALYQVKAEDIVAFNHLKENGADLIIGEKIMVPGGIKPQARSLATAPRTTASFQRVAAPPRSLGAASASGFLWPSQVHAITQYFSWHHHAIDIAGPWQTPTYAAKSGIVEKAQCGWNGGYGCYVIIDHGNGLKTLYGHHSVLLVSPGERLEAGQTIALMGNTGRVRGHTGIHLHFEVIINGVRVNPLGYVR